ncbi:Hvo_1808 family surface protein [Halorussus litoreus]|uniref:Hvo_1808 family surface protein n=1 Tax=Halorussus litoreus TaxID=1710536 RepID=UPI000E25A1D7|nr:Hvo_1808 family surface protein [Halorussus litoreus]
MRTSIAIAVVLMLVVAGCSQAPGGGTTTADTTDVTTGVDSEPGTTDSDAGTESTTSDDAEEVVKPDDPGTDVLGWEAGIWYNETIDVNPENGLNDTEMNRTVARAMARVEQIRELEFEEQVPVEIVTRDEFREEQRGGSTPNDRRLFDNAKYEALFMIGESTDSIAVQNANSGTSVGGYYSPSEERIVVVSENTSTPQLDEITLSQELFHALQDQKFDFGSFNQSTRELHNAKDGLIEGDGNYVDYLYSQRCQDEWNGDCLTPTSESGSSGQLANFGPYLLKFQPYSDGPAFVRSIQRRGGWEAVNDLYEDPPASTEQVIHPNKYGEDQPAEFNVEDRSSADWDRLRLDARPSYGSVGEAGIVSMLFYPYYPSQGQTQIVSAQQFFNLKEGSNQIQQFDPMNYNSSYSNGWDGDKLAVYTSESAAENETGYVWKSVWDSEADAQEFVDGYQQLLDYHDAESVDGHADTWRVPDDSEFGDAFYVGQQGDTVVVVNAPSVDQLSEVREGAAPEQ